MFCGGHHYHCCDCVMCRMRTGRSVKSAYRAEMAKRKAEALVKELDLMRKPLGTQITNKVGPKFNDKSFQELYPNIYEYLVLKTYDDGSYRQTMTMLIFVDGDTLKACLNDRDNNRSAFVEASTFAGLLDSIEAGLREEDLEWRIKGKADNRGQQPTY